MCNIHAFNTEVPSIDHYWSNSLDFCGTFIQILYVCTYIYSAWAAHIQPWTFRKGIKISANSSRAHVRSFAVNFDTFAGKYVLGGKKCTQYKRVTMSINCLRLLPSFCVYYSCFVRTDFCSISIGLFHKSSVMADVAQMSNAYNCASLFFYERDE